MNKPNFSKLAKDAKRVLSKHSPEILTGIGLAGMITSTVLAVKATPKALKRIEEAKEEKGEELTKVETVKAAWKPYIPAVVTGVTAGACIIGASSINYKRNAALAAAYTLSETAFAEYKEKVVETIGEKKEKVVREKVAEEKVKEYTNNNSEVIDTGTGATLYLDPLSGRVFRSNGVRIGEAINNLNYILTGGRCEYVSLNDFYDEIGLAHTDLGDDLGWNLGRDGQVRITHDRTTAKTTSGEPCFVLEYTVKPRYDYTTLY